MAKTDARLAWLLLATFLIKLLVAWVLPITGDEAYFVVWGKHPDFGFYDHPPMAGWFLTVMLWVSDAPVWLRWPSTGPNGMMVTAGMSSAACCWVRPSSPSSSPVCWG